MLTIMLGLWQAFLIPYHSTIPQYCNPRLDSSKTARRMLRDAPKHFIGVGLPVKCFLKSIMTNQAILGMDDAPVMAS